MSSPKEAASSSLPSNLLTFLTNTLCIEDEGDINAAIQVHHIGSNRVLKMDQLLTSSIIKMQILFCLAWKRIYGLWPTPKDIHVFVAHCRMLLPSRPSPFSTEDVVSYMVSCSYVKWFKDKDAIENALRAELDSVDVNPNLAKEVIVSRWSDARWSDATPPVSSKNNLMHIHDTIFSTRCASMVDNVYESNPFTTITSVSQKTGLVLRMSPVEHFRYALTHDTYFQITRMHGNAMICIVSDGRRPYADIVYAARIILDAMPQTHQRPVVVWVALQGESQVKSSIESDLGDWGVVVLDSLDLMRNVPPRFMRSILIAPGFQEPPCAPWSPSMSATFITDVVEVMPTAKYGNIILACQEDEACKTTHKSIDPMKYYIPMFKAKEDDGGVLSPKWHRDLIVQCTARMLKHESPDAPFAQLVMHLLSSKMMNSKLMKVLKMRGDVTAPAPRQTLVAIDNRENPMTIFAILQSLSCLSDSEWNVTIFCTRASSGYYRNALLPVLAQQQLDIVDAVPILSRKSFSIEDYNILLRSEFIWSYLLAKGYQHALLVQDDGFLVRRGLEDMFLLDNKWDYIGAPWVDVPENATIKTKTHGLLTGNGGLSLRNVSAMLNVAISRPVDLFLTGHLTEPEDVFFAAGIAEATPDRLPPIDVSKLFASEEILYPKSLGFHKPWPYHPRPTIIKFFEDCLKEDIPLESNVCILGKLRSG